MQDIPFVSSGYRFMVTEAPIMKMREVKGEMVPATDREGNPAFVVMLFAKPRQVEGRRPGKGEEIKVTLAADPGEGFEEGSYVELIDPVLNTWQTTGDDGRISGSGLWFKALGLKPVGAGAAQRAA
ncbi:hypothetical protein Amsp01_012780 [Amycolatopsis sp. NBRC 101858]|uniref:YdcP family protein n=1 Tax=unclassified Amycolatopsis TaxID=2618356 RepID=UPI001FF1C843|nr:MULTISPECIES: YdcP family protein [unclassified Amycolatopsis]UOX91344.1 YdcP family protein [Amycolatopsis sp. FBCC-B4732]GLY35254.1 hypothetical protein Amsp01_012780 [Amycolatopsis sp. NBRC 101858]